MEKEHNQSLLIQDFVQQASTLTASSLASLILQATSHPSLFSFSEILSLPNLLQLEGTDHAAYLALLRLFAYGTWLDYKSNATNLPRLLPEQVLKLKQLTVLTLAETNKVLSYDELLKELELFNVRELEDFLINECIYKAIVKGKLNQVRRYFEVQFAAGRDLVQGKLGIMIDTLEKWQATSENMLSLIEQKIEWAHMMYQKDENHQKEVDDMIMIAKKSLHSENSYQKGRYNLLGYGNSVLDFDESVLQSEASIRSKRRRSPNFSR